MIRRIVGVVILVLLGLGVWGGLNYGADIRARLRGCHRYVLPIHHVGVHYKWVKSTDGPTTAKDIAYQKQWERKNRTGSKPLEKLTLGSNRYQLLMNSQRWIVVPGWGTTYTTQGGRWKGKRTQVILVCGPPPHMLSEDEVASSYLEWPNGHRDYPTRTTHFHPAGEGYIFQPWRVLDTLWVEWWDDKEIAKSERMTERYGYVPYRMDAFGSPAVDTPMMATIYFDVTWLERMSLPPMRAWPTQ